ncbi:MAG: hypothetical protein JNL38_33215 [Myxococcales bacterium]|jgi:DNA-binding beta-propeller fold protein YncE|nr:hypothetical protein [Myxococcales bacterium]
MIRQATVGVAALVSAVALASCYSTGDGVAPPLDAFYYPVGLAVSEGGNVLYVANADFDLQYNGGTLQSYDLALIRRHTVLTIANPNDPNLPLIRPGTPGTRCPDVIPQKKTDDPNQRQPLGETCAPPVDSRFYWRQGVVIGAFATDLQVLRCEKAPTTTSERLGREAPCAGQGTRLFVPVRGNASLTWADIDRDDPTKPPPADRGAAYGPFRIGCGAEGNGGRCDLGHQAGRSDEPGNTRNVSLPGEPFGMAVSQDGAHAVVAHQTETKSSLFSTGFSAVDATARGATALKWVLDGVTVGGNSVAAVPHDRALECTPDAPCTAEPPRAAFLQTSRAINGVDLLRLYPDEGKRFPGSVNASPTLSRPFLVREGTVPVVANASGLDSRGIVVDRTPRLACKAKVRANPPPTAAETAAKIEACAKLPARVFIANRSPSSLVLGELGALENGAYNPDRLRIFGNLPLTVGPSRLYLAPIVDKDGRYALRLFIVCFDSATVFVYDPDTDRVENVIRTAPGPFALAFDPFDMEDVAAQAEVQTDPSFPDPRAPGAGVRRYRFAYLASFTNSFIQVIDLDDSRTPKTTFENIVFTLGNPTVPKGAK